MLKIGELALRSSVSVRTLHYYDEVGLLKPSHYTEGGHRLYGRADIARLQQIRSLRAVGLSLERINTLLSGSTATQLEIIQLHRAEVARKHEALARMDARLAGLERRLDRSEEVSADQLFETLEAMAMFEKYYTPEQLKQLEERGREVGAERIEAVQKEWQEIFAAFSALDAAGAGPDDPRALELARRSNALIEEFTGGDSGIRASLGNMYRQEGAERVLEPHGFDAGGGGAWALMQRASRSLADDPKDS